MSGAKARRGDGAGRGQGSLPAAHPTGTRLGRGQGERVGSFCRDGTATRSRHPTGARLAGVVGAGSPRAGCRDAKSWPHGKRSLRKCALRDSANHKQETTTQTRGTGKNPISTRQSNARPTLEERTYANPVCGAAGTPRLPCLLSPQPERKSDGSQWCSRRITGIRSWGSFLVPGWRGGGHRVALHDDCKMCAGSPPEAV